ncbi:glycoside hydrolase family 3 protein [Butyrivibrio sp. VCB2001]|uniref:glycoside hydrolase family 3 protein n=1 Tax=Butyrivibrio sp. VCB2001 TaxID=1280667 RepID=UPI000428A3F0|nr:glycoside hydrolase family 3 N-terminal domain-containing protein [Butyrivibrio sp. VCB2001]
MRYSSIRRVCIALVCMSVLLLVMAVAVRNQLEQTPEPNPVYEEQKLDSVAEPDIPENVESDVLEATERDAKEAEALEEDIDEAAAEVAENDKSDEVEKILSEMTLEEKIYQMFVLNPEQLTGVGQVTSAGERTRNCLEKYPVGGILYFGPNIQDPEQTKNMLAVVRTYGMEIEGVPLFLCVDEEGGRIARIAGNPSFTVQKTKPVAQIADAAEAYEAGNVIGSYLSELGFNVDFAPVSDVLTNPDNVVIGDRSFGSDAEVVAEYSRKYLEGLHNNEVLGVYKHFPGHGATSGDTHTGFSGTDKTLDEMMEVELLPFSKAQSDGADMVMVSHISVPEILGDNTPCSLSHYMITDVLRNMLGYEGLIITDAMNMSAITVNYTNEEAAVLAVNAGVDLILTPGDFKVYHAVILKKVRDGEISEERIDDSVRRIISKKIAADS